MESRRESPSIEPTYRERRAARSAAEQRLESLHGRLAWTRLAIFGTGVVIVAMLGRAGLPWLALPLAAFVPLLFVHARVLNGRDAARRAVQFYDHGLKRLSHQWAGTGLRGERYRDASHLYADDLDLFGPGGIFELLATTQTRRGEEVLAGWLLQPSAFDVVARRQAAVRELASKLDLREDLAVLGPELEPVRTHDLAAWATAAPHLKGTWPRLLLPLVAAVSTTLVGWWIWSGQPPDLLVPWLAVQGLLAWRYRHAAHHVAHGIEQREQELAALARIMARLEREHVDAPLLRELRGRLQATGRSPAEEVRRLARLIDFISSGHNQIFAPVSALLMLGTQLAFAVDAWRARCGSAVQTWLDAVGEYEALAALATYAAEHPDQPFAELVEGPPLFEATALAHPLLGDDAVANDVQLGREHPHMLLVSGSNMSGKSTLLRTVGLNVVLAQAGAPVRAERLRLTRLRVGATLRIQDSLLAGRSRFFAEISRIAEIVSHASASSPSEMAMLFLLDELLAGTNSRDRLAGAQGILHGLLDRGAIGLATTHDLALTSMVEGLGGRALNVHFEDQFADGQLTFDYRLKPGVVQTSNAIALMRAVGIDV